MDNNPIGANNNYNVATMPSQNFQEPKEEKLADASKWLGIVSLILGPLAFSIAVVGLVLGCVEKSKGGQKKAGIIMNSISLGLDIVLPLIFVTTIFGMIGNLLQLTSGTTTSSDSSIVSDNSLAPSGQMTCSTTSGSKLVISYNDEKVTGYYALGNLDYDLDYEQDKSERMGIYNYLSDYVYDFELSHPGGTCE